MPLADPPAPTLSPIVAGAWRLANWQWSATERLRWIEGCVALGVTSFDHADIYGGYTAEALFGEALALDAGLRARIQLVTKCGIRLVTPNRPENRTKHYDTSRAHLVGSVENSLRNLHTDHLDLLLLHRPDPLLHADEVAEAFTQLRADGKVRHFGVSNFSPSQFALLHDRFPLVTNQVELHPQFRNPLHDGTLDQCQQLRIRPMTWSPLAGGRLLTLNDPATVHVRKTLERIGSERNVSAATIAFAWILRHPSRPIPVSGSRRLDALEQAVRALDVTLDAQEWTEIWAAGAGHEVP